MPVNMKETCEKKNSQKYIRTDLAAECYLLRPPLTPTKEKTEQDF